MNVNTWVVSVNDALLYFGEIKCVGIIYFIKVSPQRGKIQTSALSKYNYSHGGHVITGDPTVYKRTVTQNGSCWSVRRRSARCFSKKYRISTQSVP